MHVSASELSEARGREMNIGANKLKFGLPHTISIPNADDKLTHAILCVWAQMTILGQQEALNYGMQQNINQIRVSRGLIPICAWCRRMRDDHGFWKQAEPNVLKHSKATWTHGICPECKHKLMKKYP